MHDRLAADEAPDVGIERVELLAYEEQGARVADRRFDLRAVADDSGIEHHSLDARGRDVGDEGGIEAPEKLAVALALPKDRLPAQPRLRALEHEHLEESLVVVYRHAPLGVVIRDQIRRARPRTTFWLTVAFAAFRHRKRRWSIYRNYGSIACRSVGCTRSARRHGRSGETISWESGSPVRTESSTVSGRCRCQRR